MNKLLLSIVSTNAGWLARQLVKYSAVLAAGITAFLVGKGVEVTHADVIAAGVASIALGLLESGLSWIARKYAAPELGEVNKAIEQAKKIVPTLVACVCVLSLSSCASVMTWAASPLGQASIATAKVLGKQLANAAQVQALGDIITKASASADALNAKGPESDIAREILRQSEIAGLNAVIEAAQNQYVGMTGRRFMLGKNPLPVMP
jgi:hypothetical protein